MNPNRTNDLWCKKCLWHKCRCMPAPVVLKTRAELEEMFPSSNSRQGWFSAVEPPSTQYTRAMMDGSTYGKGVVKVSYTKDGGVTVDRVDPEAMLVDPPPEPQYTRTMTMDDLRRNALDEMNEKLNQNLRRNALESVIEELKERD